VDWRRVWDTSSQHAVVGQLDVVAVEHLGPGNLRSVDEDPVAAAQVAEHHPPVADLHEGVTARDVGIPQPDGTFLLPPDHPTRCNQREALALIGAAEHQQGHVVTALIGRRHDRVANRSLVLDLPTHDALLKRQSCLRRPGATTAACLATRRGMASRPREPTRWIVSRHLVTFSRALRTGSHQHRRAKMYDWVAHRPNRALCIQRTYLHTQCSNPISGR